VFEGGLDLVIGLGRQVGGPGQFAGVRLDDIGGAVAGEAAGLGIDDQDHALGAGFEAGLDDLLGHGALAVVGQQDGPGPLGGIAGGVGDLLLGVANGGRGVFRIDAQQLLAGGDVAGLYRGRARRIADQVGFHAGLGADHPQRLLAGGVVADQPGQRRLAAKGRDVAGHIAGPAQHGRLPAQRQHGHGSLRTGAADVAVDEAIDHHIAHTGHAGADDSVEEFLKAS
jgi:hypothetical protein